MKSRGSPGRRPRRWRRRDSARGAHALARAEPAPQTSDPAQNAPRGFPGSSPEAWHAVQMWERERFQCSSAPRSSVLSSGGVIHPLAESCSISGCLVLILLRRASRR
jgi:hypothetical protein